MEAYQTMVEAQEEALETLVQNLIKDFNVWISTLMNCDREKGILKGNQLSDL